MLDYITINICISLFAVASVALTKNAHARLHFYVILFAIAGWMIPWQVLPISLPSTISHTYALPNDEALKDSMEIFTVANESLPESTKQQVTQSDTQYTPAEIVAPQSISKRLDLDFRSSMIFLVLSLFGLLLFAFDIARYNSLKKKWMLTSKQISHYRNRQWDTPEKFEIRVFSEPNRAMATGILHPTIWLSENYLLSDEWRAIVLHEHTHLKRRDPAWMWVINAIKRFFWWNPLVLFLCYRAKQLIEFSCDETCQEAMPDGLYRRSLAKVILESQPREGEAAMLLGLSYGSSVNVQRVKSLLLPKHFRFAYLALYLALFFTACTIGNTLANFHQPRHPFPFTNYRLALNINKDIQFNEYTGAEIYAVTRLVDAKRFEDAEEALRNLKDKAKKAVQSYPHLNNRTRVAMFRTEAYLYDAWGKPEKIEQVFSNYYGNKRFQTRLATKALAISFIKTDRVKEAIELLEDLVKRPSEYRSTHTHLLLAQSYHLDGQLNKSNRVINQALKHANTFMLSRMKRSLLRLKGKNLQMLGRPENASEIKRLLGEYAPKDFMHVSASNQKIPGPYRLHNFVGDTRFLGFDAEQFQALEGIQNSKFKSLHYKQNDLMKIGNYEQVIYNGLELLSKRSLNLETHDRVIINDRIATAYFLSGKHDEYLKHTASIAELDMTPAILKAKYAYFATRADNLSSAERLHHHRIYLSRLPKQSYAADITTIELSLELQSPEIAKSALRRVESFLEVSKQPASLQVYNLLASVKLQMGAKDDVAHYIAISDHYYPGKLDLSVE